MCYAHSFSQRFSHIISHTMQHITHGNDALIFIHHDYSAATSTNIIHFIRFVLFICLFCLLGYYNMYICMCNTKAQFGKAIHFAYTVCFRFVHSVQICCRRPVFPRGRGEFTRTRTINTSNRDYHKCTTNTLCILRAYTCLCILMPTYIAI